MEHKQPQQNQKPEAELTKEDLGELHPAEIRLIHYIRTRFRYGEIILKTRDGIPYQIMKHTEFQGL